MFAPSHSQRPLPIEDEDFTLQQEVEAVLAAELSLPAGRAYDQFVATAPASHYCQTRAWARVATAGKPFEPLYFLARRGEQVIGAALVLRTRLGLVPLPVAQVERGPVTAKPDDLPEVLAALHRYCLKRGITRLSVMPYWAGDDRAKSETILREAGFTDCQRVTGRHVHALRLDLAGLPDADPFSGSEFVKLRKEMRRAGRAGAVARRGHAADLQVYCDMVAARDGRLLGPDVSGALGAHFLGPDPNRAVFVCEAEGEAVSVIFAQRHGPLAYFVAGASSGKELTFSKMILPMASAVLWARQLGSATFDFGGMPMPGDTDPKRNSIALFKRSFSRNVVDLVHEHVRWF